MLGCSSIMYLMLCGLVMDDNDSFTLIFLTIISLL
jgi:hypothetical protein